MIGPEMVGNENAPIPERFIVSYSSKLLLRPFVGEGCMHRWSLMLCLHFRSALAAGLLCILVFRLLSCLRAGNVTRPVRGVHVFVLMLLCGLGMGSITTYTITCLWFVLLALWVLGVLGPLARWILLVRHCLLGYLIVSPCVPAFADLPSGHLPISSPKTIPSVEVEDRISHPSPL